MCSLLTFVMNRISPSTTFTVTEKIVCAYTWPDVYIIMYLYATHTHIRVSKLKLRPSRMMCFALIIRELELKAYINLIFFVLTLVTAFGFVLQLQEDTQNKHVGYFFKCTIESTGNKLFLEDHTLLSHGQILNQSTPQHCDICSCDKSLEYIIITCPRLNTEKLKHNIPNNLKTNSQATTK